MREPETCGCTTEVHRKTLHWCLLVSNAPYGNKTTVIKLLLLSLAALEDTRLHNKVLWGWPSGYTVLRLWTWEIQEGRRIFFCAKVKWRHCCPDLKCLKLTFGKLRWHFKTSDSEMWTEKSNGWEKGWAELLGYMPGSDCMSLASLVYRPICQTGLSLTT